MTRLFIKKWRVDVHNRRFEDIDIQFDVVKKLGRSPNTCKLTLFNLAASLRGELAQLARVRVILEAGYVGDSAVIFNGNLRHVTTSRSDTDILTVIEGNDGGAAYLTARVNQSFAPGASIETVVRACVSAMGLGLGNTAAAIQGARFDAGRGRSFEAGTTLSGSASRELTEILRSLGMTWSIQNGAVQLLQRGEATRRTAVLLNSTTGLLGSPHAERDGRVKAAMMLIPGVGPGQRVRLESEFVEGAFRVREAKFSGETDGNDWSILTELEPLFPVAA